MAACAATVAKVIESAQGSVYQVSEEEAAPPETHYLASYDVSADEIGSPDFQSVPEEWKDEQIDRALHEEAWNLFTAMIPAEDREMVTGYLVFTDGLSNTLAAVEQQPEDITEWIVEVDIADLEDRNALLFTLIHEYAHLLTLHSGQVTPDPDILKNPKDLTLIAERAAACPTYFTGDGCSHPDSYINQFYQRFWPDIADEWKAVDSLQYDEDQMPYFEGLYDFYLAHSDEFVDDYATTHPAEDIAESFAYFVFSPKPAGTSIKEQKVAFFHQYPELVKLRDHILANLCANTP
jgi:hypothetical protein